ncbi:hypothetical protein Q0F99_09570 [Rathayibacter oskolensis]|uniref:hypothetical protein n=1 Tax=Rathayibacter oskolensis TaxID=1891671 RepID=UPI00265F94F1|nr:hypothetical protein [Rathayibacter oskolensis]WKK73062.1 hypothetical protein Q0F99_09570 [Rathayibacter oskolensis]
MAAESSAATEVRTFFSDYGVSAMTQDNLIAVLEAGGTIDSMEEDAAPVSSRTQTKDGYDTTIDTFADGSIMVRDLQVATEAPEGSVGARAITECSLTNGGGYALYDDCLIRQSNGTTSLSFRADYQRYTGGAQITRADTAKVSAVYGEASAPTVSIVNGTSVGATEAVATAHSRLTASASSEDLYLSLRVTSDQAYSTDF